MSLNRGEVNPLGVLKLRKLSFIPKHFAKLKFEHFIDIKLLEQWIVYNLNSRYALQRGHDIDENNKLRDVIEIGLEDPKEIIMLSLGCPYIHKDKGKDIF